MGILTTGFPPQQVLVPFVKFVTFQVWKLMMNELVTHDSEGRFVRESFDGVDGSAVESLDIDGDFRLYLGNPCPWCHRIFATVSILNLSDFIPITKLVDNAEKASKGGWILPSDAPKTEGLEKELIEGDLAGVYNFLRGEKYMGRATAPLLVDTTANKIISNESNEIMVLLNDLARRKNSSPVDLRPVGLENELDAATKKWFDLLWNGSYKCGFATTQKAYDEAADGILKGFAEMDSLLTTSKYLMGEKITELDLKAFAWVCRHDYAYSKIFKSPGGSIREYVGISRWVKNMCDQYDCLYDTVDLEDACGSYYRQLFMLNFGRIVPRMQGIRDWVAGL